MLRATVMLSRGASLNKIPTTAKTARKNHARRRDVTRRIKPTRHTSVLMKIDDLCSRPPPSSRDCCIRVLRVYANLNGRARVLLWHANTSRRKVIAKPPREQSGEEKRKGRNARASSYFVWPRSWPAPVYLRHDGVSSRDILVEIIYHAYQRNISIVHARGTSKLLATCTQSRWHSNIPSFAIVYLHGTELLLIIASCWNIKLPNLTREYF